jgi:predicted DNA-binding transcriptional regulator AlpA
MPNLEENQYLDTAQAAHYIGFSKSSLEAWRLEKRGPTFLKPSGRVKYRKSDLDAFMDASRVETRN